MRWSVAVVFLALSGTSMLWGETRVIALPESAGTAAPESSDLFEAIDSGQITAKLVAQDSTHGTVIITNATKNPLTIKLPNAFAAVPVLAQNRGGGGFAGAGGGGNLGGGGGSQALGGTFGGGGGGGRGLNNGGVFFNIGPERATKLKFTAVCLEHGKPEPTSRMDYEIAPISRATDEEGIIAILEMLGQGKIAQRSAQAAAWHLANQMSWAELSKKVGVRHIGGRTESFFSSAQIEQGQRIVGEALRRSVVGAGARQSPGEVLVVRE